VASRRAPWFVIGWTVLLIVFAWLAPVSLWTPDGGVVAAAYVRCLRAGLRGNLFWAVKNRRTPRNR
jgi:hypothetical protein